MESRNFLIMFFFAEEATPPPQPDPAAVGNLPPSHPLTASHTPSPGPGRCPTATLPPPEAATAPALLNSPQGAWNTHKFQSLSSAHMILCLFLAASASCRSCQHSLQMSELPVPFWLAALPVILSLHGPDSAYHTASLQSGIE